MYLWKLHEEISNKTSENTRKGKNEVPGETGVTREDSQGNSQDDSYTELTELQSTQAWLGQEGQVLLK